MFEINVHRVTREQRRKARQRRFWSLLLGAIYIALLVLFTGIFTFHVLLLRQNISAKEEELKRTEQIYSSYGSLNEGVSVDVLRVVSHIKGDQPRWGMKLQLLATLLPPQMWLTKVSLVTEKQQGKDKNLLQVSGSIVVPEEENALTVISGYLNTLRTDERFSEDFESIELLFAKRSPNMDQVEMNFDFTCLVRR